MEKVLDLKMPGVQELGREELREVEGGFIGALALGLCAMAFAYQVGKDAAKWVKSQEAKQ
ncbi:MAG: hypothetical protein GQ525_00125 [Draconibacterium sp.]|nr:hypothetical protein [Draconibacterium sp.]